MLTLMTSSPTFCSSVPTFLVTRSRNFSRSWLISSMLSVAITSRIWPRMMSFACSRICDVVQPEEALGRVVHDLGLVEMPTVNVLGTFTRMFCFESAPIRSMSIGRGSRSRKP